MIQAIKLKKHIKGPTSEVSVTLSVSPSERDQFFFPIPSQREIAKFQSLPGIVAPTKTSRKPNPKRVLFGILTSGREAM